MSTVEAALQVAGYGFPIFPARNKRPLVTSWKDGSSSEEGVIRAWWTQHPDAEIGVPMPPGTVAIDIDDLKAANAANLEWTETSWQKTRTEGHYQRLHLTDGRDVPQVVGRGGIKLDTRSGGKGYVIAYDPGAFDRSQWSLAPDWVYENPRATEAPREPGAPLTSHAEITSWLGRFVNDNNGPDEGIILAMLIAMRATGRIVAADPLWPWSNDDFATLARDAATWEVSRPSAPLLLGEEGPRDEGLAGLDATDLLKLDLGTLEYAFTGIMPEGLGVIGAPPKAGKSLLMYQAAVALTLGEPLLGQTGERRPVRYYALEDGRRRSKNRIEAILKGRALPPGFELRWTAPKLGGPLEEEVNAYFIDNPKGVVIVDVLGKVRPTGKSGLNAYDEDYNLLTGIHRVTQKHPGSVVLFVTHDRKAGAEDWVTRLTGTRGVTGAADFIIFIHRERGKDGGIVNVTGRDVEDLTLNVSFDGSGWQLADPNVVFEANRSATRITIRRWLAENGPAHKPSIVSGTGLSADVVKHRVADMVEAEELIIDGSRGYDIPDRGGESDE